VRYMRIGFAERCTINQPYFVALRRGGMSWIKF
jgi:hypothetical protein